MTSSPSRRRRHECTCLAYEGKLVSKATYIEHAKSRLAESNEIQWDFIPRKRRSPSDSQFDHGVGSGRIGKKSSRAIDPNLSRERRNRGPQDTPSMNLEIDAQDNNSDQMMPDLNFNDTAAFSVGRNDVFYGENNSENVEIISKAIKHATHEILLQHNNQAYSQLLLENATLEGNISSLRTANKDLLARITFLATPTPPSRTASSEMPNSNDDDNGCNLDRSKYPHAKFWTMTEWKSVYKKDDKSSVKYTDSVVFPEQFADLDFLTYEDGTRITSNELKAVRSTQRRLWLSFPEIPPSWSQVKHDLLQDYFKKLYREHPFLRLCEHNWKAQTLATKDYPGWHRAHAATQSRKTKEGINPYSFLEQPSP